IYHACIRPGFWVENAYADIQSGRLRNGPGEFDVGTNLRHGVPDILWSTEFAFLSRPFKNVFAEIGTTFASCVVTFPTVCAHLFGLKTGTDDEHDGDWDDDDDDRGRGRREGNRLSRLYRPVPQNYQLALAADSETRRIMEFASDWQPCFLPGGTNTCPTNPL